MTGAEVFAQVLQSHGIEWIATLCGHGLDPLYEGCRGAGLRLVDTRNEQAASYLAEACGRLTRRPGVVAVSSGVAHVNALAGVANAFFDGAPMLLVSGAAAVSTMGRGHFQDMDQVAVAAPLCKHARLVDRVENLAPALVEALAAAVRDRPGPVHLTIPMDVQRAEAGAPAAAPLRAPRSEAVTMPLLPPAERPLLIAGSGVFYADAGEALARFCARAAMPVVTPIWDRGSIDRPMPEFMGVIGAATGGPRLLEDADLVLLCGARSDYRVGYLEPPAIRPDCRVVPIEPEHLEALAARPTPAWLAEAQRRRDEFRRAFERAAVRPPGGLHALDIVAALRAVLTEETVLLIDGGSIGQWCHQLLADRYPGHWLTCGASGVVGWGLPGAMAARLCFPGRPVILVSGDGAMTFTVAELECAVRQRLPFVAVVADDQAWGITRTGHVRQFGQAVASELGPVDFAALAVSLGARGVRVNQPAEITAEIQRGLEESIPRVIHVPIRGGNELPQISA
jgi:acetolactate synthase-1/2/3 large subunit